MCFSDNLKQFRAVQHLSQEELAQLLNVNKKNILKWEQGKIYPKTEKLLFISEKLNISLDELLGTKFAEK